MNPIDTTLCEVCGKPVQDVQQNVKSPDGKMWHGSCYSIDTKQAGADDIEELLKNSRTHYERVCLNCGYTWLGLHCPHDGYQNPCPICEVKPKQVIQTHDDNCEGVIDQEEFTQSITNLLETERERVLDLVEAGLPEDLPIKKPKSIYGYQEHNYGFNFAIDQVREVIERLKGE